MPIYEYKCKDCGESFEMIQGFSEKPHKKCQKCGGKLHKLVSDCAFHLKGSGWYVTDYGKSNKSGSTPPKASSQKTDSSADKTKSTAETKPSPSDSPSSDNY